MLWRVLPLAGVLLFYGLGFGWRMWLQARRYGGTGLVMFRSGRTGQTLREAFFLVIAVVLLVEAVRVAMVPEAGTVPPAVAALRPLGALLLLGATALMVVAQLDLGASWRIGIDEGARPGLVTRGLYRFSRNPIFLAMLLALVGFALLVPSWLSLAIVVGAFFGVRRHVTDEEDYLTRTYGEAYRAYARRVGRFLPGVGRFA